MPTPTPPLQAVATAPATLFIDRCAWSHKLGDSLKAAGIPFVAHHERFAPDAPDTEWLAAVRDNGWLIVTRDARIRYRPNELQALAAARLHVFVLTQGSLSAGETAEIVCATYPKMCSAAKQFAPPAVFSVTRSCEVNALKLKLTSFQ